MFGRRVKPISSSSSQVPPDKDEKELEWQHLPLTPLQERAPLEDLKDLFGGLSWVSSMKAAARCWVIFFALGPSLRMFAPQWYLDIDTTPSECN